MPIRSERAPPAYAGLIALGLTVGASCLAAAPSFAWPVGDSGDVTIENFAAKAKDGGELVIPRADFANTNLSKDEIVALLTPDTPEADERALVQKLKADKISIPSIDLNAKDGGKVHIRDFTANDIDQGKVGKIGFGALDGTGTDGGPVSIKSGPLSAEGLDVAELLKGIGAADAAAQKSRLSHLALSGLDIVAPDKDSGPGKTVHVSVASFDLRSNYSGDALSEGSTKIDGLVVELSPDSEGGRNLAALGYSKVELAVAIGANYKAGAKTFSISDFTIDGAQMGSIGLKADFSDVEPQVFGADNDGRMQALLGSGVVSLELKLVNAGLFEKALALYAKQQGTTTDALKQQWSAVVGQMAPLFLGGSPSALHAAGEAQKFIATPHNLTVAIKAKSGALKAPDFMAISDPTSFVNKVDISAAANQ